jgi:hypothetical protein
MLRDGAITVWEDDDTHFGYSALEAMKSGSLVIAKMPDNTQEWMENNGALSNCCIWFDNYDNVHKIIASVVRSWITNNVPSEIDDAAQVALGKYSVENTTESIVEYVKNVIDTRRKEMESMIITIKSQNKE